MIQEVFLLMKYSKVKNRKLNNRNFTQPHINLVHFGFFMNLGFPVLTFSNENCPIDT